MAAICPTIRVDSLFRAAALAAPCLIFGLLAAGCGTPTRKADGSVTSTLAVARLAPAEPSATPPTPSQSASSPPTAFTPAASRSPPDPWSRLRAGLRFADCNAPGAAAEAEQSHYLRDRHALAAQWLLVLPLLEFVLAALEDAGLPTEFALLPMVESGFRALPSQGNRPAGAWQFMPATARAHGLAIGPSYDARLDLAAATDAAIRLLSALARSFEGDWALATMAFNAGESRIRRARNARRGAQAAQLPVSPITRTHLARLLALACIVADPAAAGIDLPRWDPARRLVALPLARPMILDHAARLSGLEPITLRGLNAAWRQGPVAAGQRLLLPEASAQRLADALRTMQGPEPHRMPEHVVRAGESLWSIARRHGTSVRALARRNGLDPRRPLHPGQVLTLPAD
jgi:membrane-bound lytic murein transglycosylase D